MLNEIFKGIDNAAEKFNENFQKVNVLSGSNENGKWKIYGSGSAECRHKLRLDYDSGTLISNT